MSYCHIFEKRKVNDALCIISLKVFKGNVLMLERLKKLFSAPKEEEPKESVGRTFNRILTSKYFGLENDDADRALALELKKKKVDQIKALGLTPKFARYLYEKELESYTNEQPIALQVSFQKERYSQKRQMLHVSEMAFIVKLENFKEFEKMFNLSIEKDFIHLAPEGSYQGEERRKTTRTL